MHENHQAMQLQVLLCSGSYYTVMSGVQDSLDLKSLRAKEVLWDKKPLVKLVKSSNEFFTCSLKIHRGHDNQTVSRGKNEMYN